jgi:hypothetical protein
LAIRKFQITTAAFPRQQFLDENNSSAGEKTELLQ